MHNDIYLSFPDEALAQEVLTEAHPLRVDDEGNVVETYSVPRFKNIDTIGVIHKQTGTTTDSEGNEVPVMVALPGWHVNVRLMPDEDGSVLEPYMVNPSTPARVWA